jgi:YVTN family beta-propeller protein
MLGVVSVTTIAGCGPAADPTIPPAPHTPPGGRAGYVITTDEGASALSRIDLRTGDVRRFPLSIRAHNVQSSPDGSRIVAVGPVNVQAHDHGGAQDAQHHDGAGAGRLIALDAATMDMAAAVAVDVGSHPAHVIVSADAGRAFLTDAASHTVQVVDLVAGKVTAEIPTGRYPHGLRMNPGGSEIAVANVEDHSVSIVSVAEARERARIPVGKAPVQVAWSPDGTHVFVSLRDEDAVAVVDVAARRMAASIPVGDGPIQLFATPDGRFVYVANEGTEESPATTVSVIDASSLRVVQTIEAGQGPHGVVTSPDGERVYVTNRFSDSVSEIDVATQTVLRTYQVGDAPTGITYVPLQ